MLYLSLTSRCNLRCKHCYLNKESEAVRPSDFQQENLKFLIKYLFFYLRKFQNSQNIRRAVFHAGEPLLIEKNLREKVVILLRKMGFDVGIETNLIFSFFNGLGELSSESEFLINNFNSIGSSIDLNRIKLWDKIFENSYNLYFHGVPVSFMVAINFDDNFDLLKEMFYEIEKMHKITGVTSFRIVLEHPWNEGRDFVEFELFKEIFDFVSSLKSFQEFQIVKKMNKKFLSLLNTCSPVYGGDCLFNGVRVIGPDGKIYFCPDNLNKDYFSIGDIFSFENKKPHFLDLYLKFRVNVHKFCSKCEYFNLCKGGCFQVAYLNYKKNGELFDYYCRHYQYVIKKLID